MLLRLSRLIVNELRILRSIVLKRAFERRGVTKDIREAFHRLYFDLSTETWGNTSWLGAPTQKCPLDLWIYQEIIAETRPDLIVETGTAGGGSALFLASVCELLGAGRVITIDVAAADERPSHDRVEYIRGSSVAPETVEAVRAAAKEAGKVMVVLDSHHAMRHVLDEMRLYAPLVSSGCYMIVEDTNLNGHPVHPGHGPGPMEAVESFLAEDDSFEVDRSREKLLLTFNPKGFLRRR